MTSHTSFFYSSITLNPHPIGGCYVTAKRPLTVLEHYQSWCIHHQLPFSVSSSVLSPDSSTLFTTSGMQKHKPLFNDSHYSQVTLGDVQHCLRLNDLEEIGDQTHYLDFWMLGLFSFQDWSLKQGIDFWFHFLLSIGIPPDTVTIPPHRPEWRELYSHLPVQVQEDPECVWSDGVIGGDCTEFYRHGVEVGNIVYTLNRSLDCGFGLERLENFYNPNSETRLKKEEVLFRTIEVLLKEGVTPSPKQQGYVLRRLIRQQWKEQGLLPEHPLVEKEKKRLEKVQNDGPLILKKHPGQSPQFYWETFGLDLDDLNPSTRPSI